MKNCVTKAYSESSVRVVNRAPGERIQEVSKRKLGSKEEARERYMLMSGGPLNGEQQHY